MSTPSYDYQELDAATRDSMIRSRLRDLEREHFSLHLRESEVADDPEAVARLVEGRARIEKAMNGVRERRPVDPTVRP